MRSDFKKLLVEHERVGSYKNYGMVRHVKHNQPDEEFVERRKSMKAPHQKGWGTKEFSENLNPLKRFLNSNVGRPWDKIYSEIKAQNPGNSAVGAHIMQHLWQFVTKPELVHYVDGKPYERPWFGGPLRSMTGLYVNAAGILVKAKEVGFVKHRRQQKQEAKAKLLAVKRIQGPYLEFHKEDGIWYAYVLKDVPPKIERIVPPTSAYILAVWEKLSREQKLAQGGIIKTVDATIRSVNPKKNLTEGTVLGPLKYTNESYRFQKPLPATKYYASRRQMSAKELKKHGLQNDEPKENPRPASQRERRKKVSA